MLRLSVDGSFENIGITVFDEDAVVYDLFIDSKNTHSKILVTAFKDAFKLLSVDVSDIDEVFCSIGYGRYTSLRVVIATIKGMFFDRLEFVYAVNTLDLMAASYMGSESIVRVLSYPFSKEVYFADYNIGLNGIERISEIEKCSEEEIASYGKFMIAPYKNSYSCKVLPQTRNVVKLGYDYFKKVKLFDLSPLY